MAEAEPQAEARNEAGELIHRVLELRLDAEIAEPPYEAAFALEDVDQGEEETRKIHVFYYDPANPEGLHRELRQYLRPILHVTFPRQDEKDRAAVATANKLEAAAPPQAEDE